MNKNEFMATVTLSIKKMPEEEKQDILYDFEEYFQEGLLQGRTEEDIAASLGNPKTLIKQMVAVKLVEQASSSNNTQQTLKAIASVISLNFLTFLIFILPLALIATFMIGGVASFLAGVSGPIYYFSNGILTPFGPLTIILAGISATLFGILLILCARWLIKLLRLSTMKFLQYKTRVSSNWRKIR